MQRLIRRQLARARDPSGAVDIELLAGLVASTYEEFDRDRERSDRANRLMSSELSEAYERLTRSAEALRIQNRRFEAALDNMSQGLCMFGANRRIVVCNERLTRMLGLPAPSALEDLTLADFVANAAPFAEASDEALGCARKYIDLAGHDEHAILDLPLPDGRILLIAHEPLADGGFVQTFEDITERQNAQARIVHLATHDTLTDLPNRRLLRQRLETLLTAADSPRECAVLCLDLDRFKPVNDALGHAAGDQLLKAVSLRLREQIRSGDTVARLGGDEFALVMVDVVDREQAAVLAARLLRAVSRPYDIGGNTVVIGVSIGIALVPLDGRDPEMLIKRADLALYHAKRSGRSRYEFFEPAMDVHAQSRLALEVDLRRALSEDQLELYFQPVVAVDARTVCGFEALLRWNCPSRGQVPPDVFIPLAEELGLIVQIGNWVLREACRAAAAWPDDIKVAVNVSAQQFKSGSLVRSVKAALQAAGLPARRLELEITETVLMNNDSSVLETLHGLRELGAAIVMDDFGTGYSSLAYLRSFPFDKVKIDRSFVNGLGRQADSMAIVRAVTGLCNSLGIPSTAEGVETGEQLELLDHERCTQAQGYLFSRPRPERDIPAMLAALRAWRSGDDAVAVTLDAPGTDLPVATPA
ncbi:MAG TPA: EAL domain-containing protein [Burkholderiaceae bacterium]|nr:EAL domain-containing protein [Burkholderiaceae bacterium]